MTNSTAAVNVVQDIALLYVLQLGVLCSIARVHFKYPLVETRFHDLEHLPFYYNRRLIEGVVVNKFRKSSQGDVPQLKNE